MIRLIARGFRLMFGIVFIVCAPFFLIREKAPAAAFASLCLGIALIIPTRIRIRGRINPFWTTIPLKQCITPPVLLSACRWGIGFIYVAAGIGGFGQKEYQQALAVFLMGMIYVSPLDRFFFPVLQFPKDKKARTRSILIVVMRNTGILFHTIAFGNYLEQQLVIANILLVVAFGLLLTAALLVPDSLLAPQSDAVAFSIRSFKMSSLEFKIPPLKSDPPKQPVAVQTNKNRSAPSFSPAKAVKKPVKKRYADAYKVQWKMKPSTTEAEFNQWISDFQVNWLEAKEYQQRLLMHRDPVEFKNQVIDELNTYIQEIRERPDMIVKNYDSKGIVTTSCVADYIIFVWKSNKQLRSLYKAAKAYSSQRGAKSFWRYAAHVAEYRAMINLIKRIKRTQPTVFKRTAGKQSSDNKYQEIEIQLGSHITSAVIASLLKSAPDLPAIARKSTPGLSDETYFKIIDSIILLGKDLENYKDLTDKMSEERYRDYFLPYLNSVSMEYSAKGEVFNRKGKTDILVFDDQGNNVFVAECKLWRGEAYLLAGIDQLFDNYVKWRDEKTAIIIFNRDVKKFSDVIITATSALTHHPLYAGGGEQRSDTSWSFRFRHPHDDQRLMRLELILFNFA